MFHMPITTVFMVPSITTEDTTEVQSMLKRQVVSTPKSKMVMYFYNM